MIFRRMNWERYLTEWAESQLGQPFAWTAGDCAALVRGAVRAMTGQPDWAADTVGNYAYFDEPGARAWAAALGGIPGALEQRGLEAVGVSPRPGDVVLVGDLSCFVVVHNRLLGVEEGQAVRWYELGILAALAQTQRLLVFRVPL